MRKFRVLVLITLGPDMELALSAAQVKRRAHRLEALGEGCFRPKELLQFKVGEELGIEGEIPKSMLESLEALDGEPVRADVTPPKTEKPNKPKAPSAGRSRSSGRKASREEKPTAEQSGAAGADADSAAAGPGSASDAV